MANLNRVQLIGNVGKEPESTYVPSGKMVTKFSLAVNNTYKVGDEERKETEWFNIEAWGKLAEIIKEHVKKGSSLYLEGRLKTDKFEKNGDTKYFTKVVVSSFQFLSGRNTSSSESETSEEGDTTVPLEDDIPF